MTKHKFAIGEKIAVYSFDKRYVCRVINLDSDSLLTVRCLADDEYFVAYPNQCRKLVSKARTWWVRESQMDFEARVKPFDREGRDWIEVKEVMKKKRLK